ncbi:MAG TPA: hypothetical protein VFH27_03915 [Longimicrobiaceae bacterium]|nr:hypothetical protein [Longimicrobiaceae bacterium]
MYYEDESRRFNVVSGLLCGAVLGAGLALVTAPRRRARAAGAARLAADLGRGAVQRIGGLREGVSGLADGAARAGRKRFRL